LDVNDDGFVSARDALDIINDINAFGPRSLLTGILVAPYIDTSADDFVAPNDVLDVINYINAHPDGEGEHPDSVGKSVQETAAIGHSQSVTESQVAPLVGTSIAELRGPIVAGEGESAPVDRAGFSELIELLAWDVVSQPKRRGTQGQY
jgi:hypothetical protein